MSGQNNTNRPRPTNSGQRIGRIGQWGASSGDTSNNSSRSSSAARIATFRDLQSSSGGGGGFPAPSASGDDADSDDGREGQTWFTGGERSGLSVQNPNRRGDGSGAPGPEIVRNILSKAANPSASEPSEPPTRRSMFSGSGHTLGSDEVESQLIPDPNAQPEQSQADERVIRHITFWRNGFSVEDGPLFRYDDPANEDVLRSIDQGTAPAELMNVRYGQSVELRVTRRAGEDYVPPPPRPAQPFGGSGQRLGAPTPPIAGAGPTAVGSTAPASSSSTAPVVRDNEPQSLQIKYDAGDSDEDTTTIRIRLADGTVHLCRMKLTSTVGDIRNFVNAARAENLTRQYTISTTYPNRILDDDTQTIEALKLQKSVVVQRWVQ